VLVIITYVKNFIEIDALLVRGGNFHLI